MHQRLSIALSSNKKGGGPFGTLRLLVSVPDPFQGPAREGALLLLRWYDDPVAADRHDTEVVATVLLPAGFVVLGANRALLAVRHEVEAICCNARLGGLLLSPPVACYARLRRQRAGYS